MSTAARHALSGEDTGDHFQCQDDEMPAFLGAVDDPPVVVAAFEWLCHSDASFRKVGRVPAAAESGWDFRFSFRTIQLDDV